MTTWGNPETKSFSQNLRLATYDETKVSVHRLVWPIVERVFQALEQRGVAVADAEESTDPLKRGFKLKLADDDELLEWVEENFAPAKIAYADGLFAFTGDADEAESISGALLAAAAEAEQVPEVEPEELEAVESILSVEKFTMDSSDANTVKLIQALTGLPLTGDLDDETRAALIDWQNHRRVAPTGEIDEDTWSQILPSRVKWLRPGATGLPVSVMQAAFKVHGFYEAPVTGVWGVELSQALRRVQPAFGIHPRLRIGLPEWATFFQPKV